MMKPKRLLAAVRAVLAVASGAASQGRAETLEIGITNNTDRTMGPWVGLLNDRA